MGAPQREGWSAWGQEAQGSGKGALPLPSWEVTAELLSQAGRLGLYQEEGGGWGHTSAFGGLPGEVLFRPHLTGVPLRRAWGAGPWQRGQAFALKKAGHGRG